MNCTALKIMYEQINILSCGYWYRPDNVQINRFELK